MMFNIVVVSCTVLCRVSMLYTFWGIGTLLPLYATGEGGASWWNIYTLANVPDPTTSQSSPSLTDRLWAPVVFAYAFTGR